MKYTKNVTQLGLGQLERERLSKLLRETVVTISVPKAASILELEPNQASKILSLYNKKGWLKRISNGIYLPVPLESSTSNIIVMEPFAVAEKLFSPCYIGAMNAVNYWDLTDQTFRTISVMTQKKVKKSKQNVSGTEFSIHTIKKEYFFGLKSIWSGGIKVKISDPTRTLVDMAMFPQFCGGINFLSETLQNYNRSKYKDMDLLSKYLDNAQNGAAIKRLGFLVEKFYPEETKFIEYCLKNLTKGYIKLSPNVECTRLIRRWNLWVSDFWKDKK